MRGASTEQRKDAFKEALRRRELSSAVPLQFFEVLPGERQSSEVDLLFGDRRVHFIQGGNGLSINEQASDLAVKMRGSVLPVGTRLDSGYLLEIPQRSGAKLYVQVRVRNLAAGRFGYVFETIVRSHEALRLSFVMSRESADYESGIHTLRNFPGHDYVPVWSLGGSELDNINVSAGDQKTHSNSSQAFLHYDVSHQVEGGDVHPSWILESVAQDSMIFGPDGEIVRQGHHLAIAGGESFRIGNLEFQVLEANAQRIQVKQVDAENQSALEQIQSAQAVLLLQDSREGEDAQYLELTLPFDAIPLGTSQVSLYRRAPVAHSQFKIGDFTLEDGVWHMILEKDDIPQGPVFLRYGDEGSILQDTSKLVRKWF